MLGDENIFSFQQPQATIKSQSNTRPLEEELYRALRPHFRTNDDTKRVVITFKQVYSDKIHLIEF